MTRRVSKAGNAYTEGSSAVPPPCYPLICERCSRRILTSKESFEQRCQHLPTGTLFRSWHIPACPPA